MFNMELPAIHGLIRRRILVNFRVDPDVVQRQLPAPFRPKLLDGAAVAGICLIRIERVRPKALPLPDAVPCGWASENAAHRIAVEWTGEDGQHHEGVYIPRRDTASLTNALLGGRVFPGEHSRARFDVRDDGATVALTLRTRGAAADVRLHARAAHDAHALPATSRFSSLQEASAFFAAGDTGYSPAAGGGRLEGLRLCTRAWAVAPLDVETVEARYFADPERFPAGSVTFDSALIMRNIPHEWQALPDLPGPVC
jgi:hypothetical protein